MQQLDRDCSVYVLDDDVITSQKSFEFDSIDDVAAHCLPIIENIVHRHKHLSGISQIDDISIADNNNNHNKTNKDCLEIILAGWSYGGVVATAVAKLITTHKNNLKDKVIVIKCLILLDSPLRAKKISESTNTDDNHNDDDDDDIITLSTVGTIQSNTKNIEYYSNQHFQSCTDLLRKYHLRDAENKPLECIICDIRPIETNYDCDIYAIEELTTGKVTRKIVDGTHWTMLFNENTKNISKILNTYI